LISTEQLLGILGNEGSSEGGKQYKVGRLYIGDVQNTAFLQCLYANLGHSVTFRLV